MPHEQNPRHSHVRDSLPGEPRTPERLRHHYEVERDLADRLRHSPREERTVLFKSLYQELFDRVPDHPRLVRRETPEETRRAVAARMSMLRALLPGVRTFVEFAPGDCRLAFEVCKHVEKVIGVDISDQTGGGGNRPANFQLVVYDGYHLDLPPGAADLVFSYQFLEHLHPDDVQPHFRIVHNLLRPGGAYVFSTPHAFSGPHDISALFSDVPRGFHFKEWTYGEMTRLLKSLGFHAAWTFRLGKARDTALWNSATLAAEKVVGWLPRRPRRAVSKRLFQAVSMVALK
jgi:SAM-dependent methyltransferase